MALLSKEKYDQKKIDNLQEYLRLYSQRGQPIDYEILVDGFKAVRRTSDPEMFSMFENFVNPDTRSMEVLLFTGSSNNNEKRIFLFADEKKEELSGMDVKSQVKEELEKERQALQLVQLHDENQKLNDKIKSLEGQIGELEKQNARLEASQSPLNNFLGDIGASLVESFIKRNPKLMANIPGGEALAGYLQAEPSDEQTEPLAESKVSFKAKVDSATVVSEEDKSAIAFVNQIKAQFAKEEFDKVLIVLQAFADDKTRINQVLEHLNIKQ